MERWVGFSKASRRWAGRKEIRKPLEARWEENGKDG